MSAKAKSAKRKKKAYMSDEAFAVLMEGMHEVLAIERGEKIDGYRETLREVPYPPKLRSQVHIVELRQRLGHSQRAFASLLNVSPKTIQAWEEGTRKPSDAALKLLAVADKHPDALYDAE